MKQLLILSAVLLSTSAVTAQTKPTPAKANTIIVYGLGIQEAAWQKAAQTLAASGWAIKNSSKDLLTFTTEPKDIGRGQTMSLAASVKDSLITFTAIQTTPSLQPAMVDYRGMQGSPARRAWDAFEAAVRTVGTSYYAEKR